LITGIGIDIIETERIRDVCQKPRFMEKIFTVKEREFFDGQNNNPQVIAGNFAAKEAVSKALGTGIGRIGWHDIEVLRDSYGKPYVTLYGRASDELMRMNGKKIWLTITHIRLLALAQAIIED